MIHAIRRGLMVLFEDEPRPASSKSLEAASQVALYMKASGYDVSIRTDTRQAAVTVKLSDSIVDLTTAATLLDLATKEALACHQK